MGAQEGWNAQTEEFGNMLKMGIVDPTKVVRLAIELSASVAALLLTTEALITDEVEEKSQAGGHAIAERVTNPTPLLFCQIKALLSECLFLFHYS